MKQKNVCRIIKVKNKDAQVLDSLCNLESHKKGQTVKPSEYIRMLIRKEASYAGEYIGQDYEENNSDNTPIGFTAD